MYPFCQGLPASTGIGSEPTSFHQFVNASQMNSEPLSLRILVGDLLASHPSHDPPHLGSRH